MLPDVGSILDFWLTKQKQRFEKDHWRDITATKFDIYVFINIGQFWKNIIKYLEPPSNLAATWLWYFIDDALPMQVLLIGNPWWALSHECFFQLLWVIISFFISFLILSYVTNASWCGTHFGFLIDKAKIDFWKGPLEGYYSQVYFQII
jgi:hypothetical protein